MTSSDGRRSNASPESGKGPVAGALHREPRRVERYDSLLSEPSSPPEVIISASEPRPPIVPSDAVMPRPVSVRLSGADVPVRLVPARALELRVRDDAFRRVPPERLLVFLRPPDERELVF